jgi:toxin ParE1/3/4
MSPTILRRDEAIKDLIELADYIARDSVAAADRFLDAAELAIADLAQMPGIGSAREYSDRAIQGIRMWPIPGFPNNLIFYRPIKGGIEVVRVLHAARDIPGILADDE